jgi:hypothetical protein
VNISGLLCAPSATVLSASAHSTKSEIVLALPETTFLKTVARKTQTKSSSRTKKCLFGLLDAKMEGYT